MQTTYLVDPSDIAVINARSKGELLSCLSPIVGDCAIFLSQSDLKSSALMFLNQGLLTVQDILNHVR